MASRNEPSPGIEPQPLVVSRVFAASRELVFQAWSSAEHIRQWFCPEGYTIPAARVELRAGGPFHVCMRSPTGQDHWTKGTFVEVVPNTRLIIDMEVVGADDRVLFRAYTVVNFEEQRGGGTRLDVTQSYTVFDSMAAPMIQGAAPGWRQTLDRLDNELARMKQSAPPGRALTE